MILVDLKDGQGLGNQLWLIATGIFISKKKSRKLVLRNIDQFFAKNLLTDKFFSEIELFDLKHLNIEWSVFSPLAFKNIKFNENIDLRDSEKFLDFFDIYEYVEIDGNYQSILLIPPPKILREYFNFDKNSLKRSIDPNVCLINVRGGDYLGLFRSPSVNLKYFYNCIDIFKKKIPNVEFKIVTDDYEYVRNILPQFEIIQGGIEEDFINLQNAKYLILSNSSFAFFPVYLSNQVNLVFAPYGWASSNQILKNKFWMSPCNFNEKFIFINEQGQLTKNYSYYDAVYDSNKNLLPPQESILKKRKYDEIRDNKIHFNGQKISIEGEIIKTPKEKLRRFLALKISLLKRLKLQFARNIKNLKGF